jgi:hypothetical protein
VLPRGDVKVKRVELVACLILACSLVSSCQRDSREKTFTGFWKGECSDAFGLRIMPYDKSHYSVSFCGPGGCFEVGEWTPNTTIEGDPKYRVISRNVIEILRTDGDWQRYQKCTTETHPTLDYSTMKGRKPNSRIVYFQPYIGLPDYEHSPPFVVTDEKDHARLGKALAGARASSKECVVGAVPVPPLEEFPLQSNICQKSVFVGIKSAVKALAPGLDEDRLSFWKIDIDGDAEPELIVGYVDISEDKYFKYPYLSLWLLKRVQGRYKATHVGPFLSGALHAVRVFGVDHKNKIVFVRHQS